MNFGDYFPRVEEAAKWLKQEVGITPKATVVLSGGLDAFLDKIENKVPVEASYIPHFPSSRAQGHAGKFVFGTFKGLPIVAMQGRQHCYEGHEPSMVVFPHMVLNKLGSQVLINTNAVGGIRMDLNPGDIVVTNDHINFMGMNPLVGIAVQRKENQFTSMTNAYDSELRELTFKLAKENNIEVKDGVYIAVSGPNYETKAEIKAFRMWGADTVGMSTVPEVLAANFLGMKVLVLNIITNPAADRHGGTMTHHEVLDAMKNASPKVVKLLELVVAELAKKK